LRALLFPIPPLTEQAHIVARIESLLARVNAARERLAKAPAILKRFRQSGLAAACSGRLTAAWRNADAECDDRMPDKWKAVSLGELLDEIFDGPFGSNLKTADYTENGVRVIRLENIGYLKFVSSKKTYISEEKYAQLRKHTVTEGDIIFGSFIDD